MKIKKLSIILTAIITLTVISSIPVSANSNQLSADEVYTIKQPYSYQLTPKSSSWATLGVDKHSICNIPQSTAKNMTTEALLESVLNYPYFVDIFAFDSLQEGFDVVCSRFNGLKELSERTDVLSVINKYSYDDNAYSINTDLPIYLMINTLKKIFTNTDVSPLQKNDSSLKLLITTPKGTTVHNYDLDRDWSRYNTTGAEQNIIAQSYLAIYTTTVKVGEPSPSYNCHSYAWYSTYANNVWLGSPTTYITDGSYVVSTPYTGRKVQYDAGDMGYHSAIWYSTGSSITSNSVVTSKWGYSAVFRHSYWDCPYYNSGLTILTYRLS